MIAKINGSCYIDLLRSGIKNLEKHRTILNDLNVFPVPDGDTGTNMVMTLRYGLEAVKDTGKTLSEISEKFSSAAVFGARGNSGVIVSQFFKGLSKAFENIEFADAENFAKALESGYKYAYASVAKPAEGTILTVIKDASLAVNNALPLASINEAIDVFIKEAQESLAHTPDLLPILKKANVVDSGGSGIVYFFEGVKKHLDGEEIEVKEDEAKGEYIDLSLFNKDTEFSFGYCVEGLIQLKIEVSDFCHEKFKQKLSEYGTSIVSSLEKDKVKIHIHTMTPGQLINYCQEYGEFLTIKIENMSVQNIQKDTNKPDAQKFLYDSKREQANYAVIAVAPNQNMQECFFDMGADVVILSEIAPSSQDFIDAFELTSADNILVFPNCSNSILSAMQACRLYKKAKVTVLNTRSVAECYATLSILDFDSTIDEATSLANDTISGIYQFSIHHATKSVKFGNRRIEKNDFFALANNKILDVKDSLNSVTLQTVSSVLDKHCYEVITLFYGKYVSEEYIENLLEQLNELGYDAEFATVSTDETIYDIIITFE